MSGRGGLRLGPLVMGGAGFSYQLTSAPESLPAVDILERAFELGLRAIDTSPYYHPSEEILGKALADSRIKDRYRREDYILMTKAGRVKADHFDYSPGWIRTSVERSLQRFQTSYLDVVFCHDVEFVSIEDAITAVGTLFDLAREGKVHYAGISGYDLDVLKSVASGVLERHSRPVDVVQCWAQLTLQNTQLERHGLDAFRMAGVKAVCASSPLAVGLLRKGGVPIGSLGDWHPAPAGLREAAARAADIVEARGDNLAALGLRYAMAKAAQNTSHGIIVSTITGIGSLEDVEQNVETARKVVGDSFLSVTADGAETAAKPYGQLNHELLGKDDELVDEVHEILGDWIDYDFSRPIPAAKRQI